MTRRNSNNNIWYSVHTGDSISNIAQKHFIKNWLIIYDHPKNVGFRRRNSDPHALTKDDSLWIPPSPIRHMARSGEKNTFRLTSTLCS